MAWKDLLLHLWVGSELNPLWHSCVGHAIVRRDDLKNMSKFDNKWGDVSTYFFKDIHIYSYIGQKKLNTTIIKCDDVIFKKCCSLFKAHADYQQSAGSIFKTNVKCIDHICDTKNDKHWKVIPKSTVGLCGDGINKLYFDIGQSSRYYLQHNCKNRDQGENKVI